MELDKEVISWRRLAVTYHAMIAATGALGCALIAFRGSTQEKRGRQSTQHWML